MIPQILLAILWLAASPVEDPAEVQLPKPLTSEFLAGIEQVPEGKLGAAASPEFYAIVDQGLGIVPELIDLVGDPTPTDRIVPLVGGYYAVGDIAMSAINSIVAHVPWLEFITSPDDPRIEAIGFGVYWAYVRESPENRLEIQSHIRRWFQQNEINLVWRPVPELPMGGQFELPDDDDD
jgi:hypothetical protein